VNINDDAFENEVFKSLLPVVVDFWAPWCGPCKMLSPVIDELEKEFAGRAKFVKMNIDDNSRTPTKYGIMSIPTLMFFRNGQVMDQAVGALGKSELKRKIEELLR